MFVVCFGLHIKGNFFSCSNMNINNLFYVLFCFSYFILQSGINGPHWNVLRTVYSEVTSYIYREGQNEIHSERRFREVKERRKTRYIMMWL